MLKSRILLTAAAVFCLLPQAALAAGAYVVDDSGIVEPGKVQIESWYSRSDKKENIGTIDAAYQLLPNAEFTLLNAYNRAPDSDDDALEAQVKYQLLNDKDNAGWGVAPVFGFAQSATQNRFGGAYAYIPVTYAPYEALNLRANLGWEYDAVAVRHFLTWGAGSEYHVTRILSVVDEVFGATTRETAAQVGPRFALTDNVVLDLIYGRNITFTPANWATVGLTMTW